MYGVIGEYSINVLVPCVTQLILQVGSAYCFYVCDDGLASGLGFELT